MESQKDGRIAWEQYVHDRESTHPPHGTELLLILLDKNGHPEFVSRAMFGLDGVFYRLPAAVPIGKGLLQAGKKEAVNKEEYADISWATLNVPYWWTKKE